MTDAGPVGLGVRVTRAYTLAPDGVLLPRRPGLGPIALDRPAADIYRAIAQGALPPGASFAVPGRFQRLVLDAAVELSAADRFVSGAAAHEWLHPDLPAPRESGPLARLSRRAIDHAITAQDDDHEASSRRLYLFNRLPLSPAWRRTLPTPAAVGLLLGIAQRGRNRRILDASGVCTVDQNWLRWRPQTASRAGEVRHKLYVSPAPSQLAETLDRAVPILVHADPLGFKVVRTAAGVLRPDKLVAYFDDGEAMLATADRLVDALDGVAAHGVPFTAAVGDGKLISTGIDPEPSPGERALSWRLAVCDRLASALAVARHTPADTRPAWAFALHRLALDGVDVTCWRAAR